MNSSEQTIGIRHITSVDASNLTQEQANEHMQKLVQNYNPEGTNSAIQPDDQPQQNTCDPVETDFSPDPKPIPDEFRRELASLINCHSLENGSGTPDFLIADYLCDQLEAFNKAQAARQNWYAR